MSKKIIKFKQDAESLLQRAHLKYEKSDYPAALSFLFRALKCDPVDTDIMLEIAIVYSDMELHEYAVKYLIRILASGRRDGDIYREIVRCYLEMQLFDQAFNFFREALDLGVFDDGSIDDILEDSPESEYAGIHMHDSRDNTNVMQLSHKLMLSGDLDFAKQLMEAIPSDSYQFVEARNSLTVIALSSDRVEEALACAQKTLEVDENNVHALTYALIAYNELGDIVKRDEFIRRLSCFDITKPNELTVAAFGLQKIGFYEDARVVLEKLIKITPYSRDSIIGCAIANSNCGFKQRARQLIVRANNIYPDDVVISYYAKIIVEAESNTNLDAISSLPFVVISEWLNDIEKWIKDGCKKPTADIKETLLWAVQSGDRKLQGFVGAKLAKYREWEGYIRNLLIDPSFDYQPKKECLQTLLINSKTKEFDLFVSDMLISFAPCIPKGVYPEEMCLAYWQVYATLSFIADDFDKKLNRAFSLLVKCYGDEQFVRFKIDPNVMSALLLHRVNMKHVFKNKIDCCEIFNCDITDFDVYSDIFFISNPLGTNRKKSSKLQPAADLSKKE